MIGLFLLSIELIYCTLMTLYNFRYLLRFDNVYPLRIHRLDPRYLFASHNHEYIIPKVMPKHCAILSMTPRAKGKQYPTWIDTYRHLVILSCFIYHPHLV